MVKGARAEKKTVWIVKILSGKRAEYLLDVGETKIGRHPNNDIVIDTDLTRVSREHGCITITEMKDGEPECSFQDIGSINGSYMIRSGHKPLELHRSSRGKGPSYTLEDKTIIRLGSDQSMNTACDIRFERKIFGLTDVG